MAAGTQHAHSNRVESPRRLVVVATLVTFWATLLVALGVPGAEPILVAALGGSAFVALRYVLAGRLPSLPPVRLGRPEFAWLPRLGHRLRAVRVPKLPPLPTLGRSPKAEIAETPPGFGGGREGEAWRFCRHGAQLRQEGRLAASVEAFETAVWIFRDLDEPRGLALALNGLGLALARQRRFDTAIAHYREATEILGGLDDRHAQGQVLANLGTALRSQGRGDEARASWEDALTRLEPGSPEYDRISELRAAS